MVLRRIRVSQAGGSRGWAEEEKQGEQGGHGQGEPGLDEGEQGGGEVAGESGEVAEVDVAADAGLTPSMSSCRCTVCRQIRLNATEQPVRVPP